MALVKLMLLSSVFLQPPTRITANPQNAAAFNMFAIGPSRRLRCGPRFRRKLKHRKHVLRLTASFTQCAQAKGIVPLGEPHACFVAHQVAVEVCWCRQT